MSRGVLHWYIIIPYDGGYCYGPVWNPWDMIGRMELESESTMSETDETQAPIEVTDEDDSQVTESAEPTALDSDDEEESAESDDSDDDEENA